jgi:hypothetical protein
MSRPHIEFVHAQQLPWLSAPFAGSVWQRVEAKTLSRDESNGACSVLLRLPAGYAAGPHRLAAMQELFVLDGQLEIDDCDYSLDCYACLPACMPRSSCRTARGAVLLAFFDREPAQLDAAAAPDWDRSQLIERSDTHNTPWTSHDIDPSVQFLRLTHKVLRDVPATGEKTILLASGAQTHPGDWREAQLKHDCVEEMYLLGGDIISERGTMYEGAYFWRPPGIWHGPFGSRRGSLALIRFAEGKHRNIWSEDVQPFVLEPAHAPSMPSSLSAAAGQAWHPAKY